MALPISALSQSAIKTALVETSYGVKYLCQSTKINKWAAFKPFQSSDTSYASSVQLETALKAADYGLSVVGYTTAAGALDIAAGSTEIWPHAKPLATVASPCRQGDFRGYNHSAVVPYSSTASPGTSTFTFSITKSSSAEILAENMATIKNGTWVILYRLGAGTTSVLTGSAVSSATFPFALSASGLAAGTYGACAAISYSGNYYPVPNTYKTFTVTAPVADSKLYLDSNLTTGTFRIRGFVSDASEYDSTKATTTKIYNLNGTQVNCGTGTITNNNIVFSWSDMVGDTEYVNTLTITSAASPASFNFTSMAQL